MIEDLFIAITIKIRWGISTYSQLQHEHQSPGPIPSSQLPLPCNTPLRLRRPRPRPRRHIATKALLIHARREGRAGRLFTLHVMASDSARAVRRRFGRATNGDAFELFERRLATECWRLLGRQLVGVRVRATAKVGFSGRVGSVVAGTSRACLGGERRVSVMVGGA